MDTPALQKLVVAALEEIKARDIEEVYGPRLVEIARKVASLVGVKGRK